MSGTCVADLEVTIINTITVDATIGNTCTVDVDIVCSGLGGGGECPIIYNIDGGNSLGVFAAINGLLDGGCA